MTDSILGTRLVVLPPHGSILSLLQELRGVRCDRSFPEEITVRQALQEFFRNPSTGKFDRLTSEHLLTEQILQTKVEKLPPELKSLVEELANGHHFSLEQHLHEKLYVSLNGLLRLSIRRLQPTRRR